MLNLALTPDEDYKFNRMSTDDRKDFLIKLHSCIKNLLNDYTIDVNSQFGKRNRRFKCLNDNRMWDNQGRAAEFYGISSCTISFLLHNRLPTKKVALKFEYIDE